MALNEQEALASIKILIAVAKADGNIDAAEHEMLQETFGGLALPGLSLDELIKGTIDIQSEAAKLTSAIGKSTTYQAACALVQADGVASSQETAALQQIKSSLQITTESDVLVSRMLNEAKETILPLSINKIEDPAQREKAINEDIWKYSILSVPLGAIPIPLAGEIATGALQVKMVHDIGQYHGHKMDKASIKAFIASAGGAVGARMAISSLAKLVPGFGSVVGATLAFASTFAFGRVAHQYFEGGAKMTPDALKKAFSLAKKDGEKMYKERQAEIDAAKKQKEAQINVIAQELKEGKISKEEYEQKIAALK